MIYRLLQGFTVLILLLIATHTFSQRALVFEQYRWNKVVRYKYFAGDHIHIKLLDGTHLKNSISSIQDSLIGIGNVFVPLKKIKKIYRKRQTMEVVAGLAKKGFILVGAIPLANGILNNDDLSQPNIALPAMISGGAYVVLSLAANTRRGFRIRDRNRLRVMFWR